MRITDWNLEDALAVAREEALEDGFERGLERGRAEKREIARRLKAMGLSDEQIAKATGLPLDELG